MYNSIMGSNKLGESKPEKAGTVQLNIRNFPEWLRTAFRILCLRKGTTKTAEIIRLVEAEVKAAKQEKR